MITQENFNSVIDNITESDSELIDLIETYEYIGLRAGGYGQVTIDGFNSMLQGSEYTESGNVFCDSMDFTQLLSESDRFKQSEILMQYFG